MNKEIWKDIPGYEGHYQVSNKGNIRSFKAKGRTVRYLNPKPNNNGYPRIGLSKDGKVQYMLVHKAMAYAFLDNPNNLKCINHKNGIKEDNRLENIEWCTYSYNNKHAYQKGLKNPERSNVTNVNKNDVIQMRNTYKLGVFTYQEIADAWAISLSQAWGIINNKYWKYV